MIPIDLVGQNNGKGKTEQREFCTTPHPPSNSSNTTLEGAEALSYSGCDVDLSLLPTKRVRITIHVFQKSDGSGNIPNNSTGRNWLENMVSAANSDMRNLKAQKIGTVISPRFSDSKIQYDLRNIYFWKNDNMWSKGNNWHSNGRSLYTYIKNKSISNKYNSIHIFIPGNHSGDGLKTDGVASGIGDDRWTLLEDVYHYYTNNNTWDIPNTLNHELGHNLDLEHSWTSDDKCPDTPPNSNCWNGSGCSNNMMDYNACKCWLSLDQVTRMHRWLHIEGDHLLSSGTYHAPGITGTISSSGYYGSLYCCTVNIGAAGATISNIASSGSNSFTWTKSSGTGSFSTNSSGTTLYLSGVTSINMKVSWTSNCVPFSKSYTFYNAGSYYTVSPTLTNNLVNVQVNNPAELLDLASQLSGKKMTTYLGRIQLIDQSGNVLIDDQPKGNAQLYQLDLGGLQQGTYFVKIMNGKLEVQTKVLKI